MKQEDRMMPDETEIENEPVKAMDLLYGVFFIGILLTFAVYVSVTMLLGANTSIGDRYLTGREHQIPLASYNEAYYKNTTLQDLITRYDYSLFGKVNDKNILVGKDNFLFEVVREDNNYHYLRDHLGEYQYEEESLESIYTFLKMRQTAYNNQGVEYVVAVIPNAQTVYSEYLPSYIQNVKGISRLEQLSDYLKTKDDITWIDLTDALLAAKSAGVLYNNTEDSLNSLGQYFVYQALYNAFPEQIKTGTKVISFDDVTLYTHHTPGKTLARTSGLSSVVKNETVSLSNTMEFNYLVQELYHGVEITYADHNGNEEIAGQTILLEFSNEWDKIQLMPYFSSTFDDVVYKSDHDFHLLSVETAQPTLVIQFIHEYELNSLTNSTTAQSYNDGLKEGQNPFTTSTPTVLDQIWLDDSTVCLSGWVEAGAELTISGDAADVRTFETGIDENLFFVLIEMADEEEVVVRLQASVEDKNRSKVAKVTIIRETDKVEPITEIVVGEESRLFVTDLPNSILPDTGTLSVMEAELRSYTEHILKNCLFKQTQFLNVVIPQSYSVYADRAPFAIQEALRAPEAYRERINELYRACGWTVIDLTEDLRDNREIGKLYALTSDRLTDHGAYIGYRSLMTHIRQDFPQVEVTPLSAYTRVSQVTAGGELAAKLGFDSENISETLIHLKLDAPEVSYLGNGNSEMDLTGAFTTMVSNGSLPVAVVLRDEVGSEMLESMARHFRVMIVLPVGETKISSDILMLFEPDYIIRLASETNPGLYDAVPNIISP